MLQESQGGYNYTFPDTSPWEIQQGKRVPKYIEVDITYQVIHSTVPNLDFAIKQAEEGKQNAFYGISKGILDKEAFKKSDGENTEYPVDADGNVDLVALAAGAVAISQIFSDDFPSFG